MNKEIVSAYNKLYIPEIITVFTLSFINIFDKVIASKFGVEIISGISLASNYAELILMVDVAIRLVTSALYSKSKDKELYYSMWSCNMVVQVIVAVLELAVAQILINFSGLSDYAKTVATVASFSYAVYYILYGFNRFQVLHMTFEYKSKEVSKINIACTVINVLCDLSVLVFGLHWSLIIFDNILTELIKYLLLRRHCIKFVFSNNWYSVAKTYAKQLYSAMIESGARRVMYIIIATILSFTGDTVYACYCIIQNIVDTLAEYAYKNDTLSVILLGDGHKIKNVKVTAFILSIIYGAISATIAFFVTTLYSEYNLNKFIIVGSTFIFVIAMTMAYIQNGVNRYEEQFKELSKLSLYTSLIMIVAIYFTSKTGNPYIIQFTWLLRYLFMFAYGLYSSRKLKKLSYNTAT